MEFERPANRQRNDMKSNFAVDGTRNARPNFGRRFLRLGKRNMCFIWTEPREPDHNHRESEQPTPLPAAKS